MCKHNRTSSKRHSQQGLTDMNTALQQELVSRLHEPRQARTNRLPPCTCDPRRLLVEPVRSSPHLCKRRKIERTGPSLRCAASSPQTASPSSDRSSGRDTYQPSSYRELVGDAAAAVAAALEAGETRLEVEFPPTPGGVNSM